MPGKGPVRPVRPFLPVKTISLPGAPLPAGPAGTSNPASPPPPARPASARGGRGIKARWALALLAVITAAAVLLGWATVSLAERGVAASQAAAKRSAGPLVIPAPKSAGGLPRRFGAITEPGSGAIIAELRHRFGAVGYRLVTDANKAARVPASAGGAAPITAAWTSGLYGQPGHLDPATGKPAWVMYLGLDATGEFGGSPAESVGQLMMGILGPYAKIGPWRVNAGHRGGAVNCTVAWLGKTTVGVCGWATSHTIGALASPIRDTSVKELATLLIRMRYELQRK